ncbi:MAG: type II toxin-antitoxin system death-on-curing family toxin [Nitrospinae bacterium]|nr:type II toxin-antitoxin system death-on-curing family toxin [Nitrospinota bacterium]MBF0633151.1 type II toxin-antitoxin system death-on-curing family toxin [Nitrospinota bacterium]
MKESVWVEKSVILAVHDLLLAEHGGSPGVRDEGLLESALARPRQLYSYGAADLCALAAVYSGGIAQNHPFVDGNKRSSFMSAYIFLERNGLRVTASEADTAQVMIDLASGKTKEDVLAEWFRKNTRRRTARDKE